MAIGNWKCEKYHNTLLPIFYYGIIKIDFVKHRIIQMTPTIYFCFRCIVWWRVWSTVWLIGNKIKKRIRFERIRYEKSSIRIVFWKFRCFCSSEFGNSEKFPAILTELWEIVNWIPNKYQNCFFVLLKFRMKACFKLTWGLNLNFKGVGKWLSASNFLLKGNSSDIKGISREFAYKCHYERSYNVKCW